MDMTKWYQSRVTILGPFGIEKYLSIVESSGIIIFTMTSNWI